MGSATTPTTVSTATMPTSMTDAEATRLGLKVYSHGTTYNGGIAPTITGQPGLTQLQNKFIPYQLQDGSWRLRFSFSYTITSAANGDFFLNGISTAGMTEQPIHLAPVNASVLYSRVDPNPSPVQFVVRTVGSQGTWHTTGDIALVSKPTWAY